MVPAHETLGINLVNLFRARGACSEPPIFCDYLDTADRASIAGSVRQDLLNLFSADFSGMNVGRRQFLKGCFLLQRGGGVDAFINGIAEVLCKFTVNFAGILSEARGDFRGEQAGNDAVLVGGPHNPITAEE